MDENIKRMPHTPELVAQMIAETGMTEQELTGAGLDLLHFYWTVHKNGGSLGVKIPGRGSNFHRVTVEIPGMTGPQIDRDS